MSLVADYESESESEPEQKCGPSSPAHRLPVPALLTNKLDTEKYIDKPDNHDGRIRSFPHERGNWATFVYIPFEPKEKLINFAKTLMKQCSEIAEFNLVDDFHLSLSRTVILKYHWISTFLCSLKDVVNNINSFNINFNCLDVYCNEEHTRTFIGLKADSLSSEILESLVKNIDKLLLDFNLQIYYTNPSFHISFIWCLGDKTKELNQTVKLCKSLLQKYLCDNIDFQEQTFDNIFVNQIYCKSGNKLSRFSTKDVY